MKGRQNERKNMKRKRRENLVRETSRQSEHSSPILPVCRAAPLSVRPLNISDKTQDFQMPGSIGRA